MLAQERVHCILMDQAKKFSSTFPQLEFIWNKHHRHGSDAASLLGRPLCFWYLFLTPKELAGPISTSSPEFCTNAGAQNSSLPSKPLSLHLLSLPQTLVPGWTGPGVCTRKGMKEWCADLSPDCRRRPPVHFCSTNMIVPCSQVCVRQCA